KRNRKTEESRALNVRAAAALVVCGLALLIAEGSLDANTFDNNAPTGCEGEVGGTYTPPVETEDSTARALCAAAEHPVRLNNGTVLESLADTGLSGPLGDIGFGHPRSYSGRMNASTRHQGP